MIMSALYAMQYQGAGPTANNSGMGALFVGKGVISGVDVGGGRYAGTYTEANGRVRGTATLSFPSGGILVTGAQLPAGSQIPLSVDWPTDFANGKPHPISVLGQQVNVVLDRISAIP